MESSHDTSQEQPSSIQITIEDNEGEEEEEEEEEEEVRSVRQTRSKTRKMTRGSIFIDVSEFDDDDGGMSVIDVSSQEHPERPQPEVEPTLLERAQRIRDELPRINALEVQFRREEEPINLRMRRYEDQVNEQLRQFHINYQKELTARDEEIFKLRAEVDKSARLTTAKFIAHTQQIDDLRGQYDTLAQQFQQFNDQFMLRDQPQPQPQQPQAQQAQADGGEYAGALITVAGSFKMQHSDLGRLIETNGYHYSATLTQHCRFLISEPVDKVSRKSELALQYGIENKSAAFLAQLLHIPVNELV